MIGRLVHGDALALPVRLGRLCTPVCRGTPPTETLTWGCSPLLLQQAILHLSILNLLTTRAADVRPGINCASVPAHIESLVHEQLMIL